MTDELKFEVGGVYKNMKGPFEVVSIHRDDMVIRWGNGTEITTTVNLQKRIIERMAHEKTIKQQQAEKLKKAKAPKKKKAAAAKKK